MKKTILILGIISLILLSGCQNYKKETYNNLDAVRNHSFNVEDIKIDYCAIYVFNNQDNQNYTWFDIYNLNLCDNIKEQCNFNYRCVWEINDVGKYTNDKNYIIDYIGTCKCNV